MAESQKSTKKWWKRERTVPETVKWYFWVTENLKIPAENVKLFLKIVGTRKLFWKTVENTQKTMKSGWKWENRKKSYRKPETHKIFHRKPETDPLYPPHFGSQKVLQSITNSSIVGFSDFQVQQFIFPLMGKSQIFPDDNFLCSKPVYNSLKLQLILPVVISLSV